MSRRTLHSSLVVAALVALAGIGSLYALGGAAGSDHADSPAVLARPGADLTDVYVFPAPHNDANVVVAVDVHPLIAPGMGASTYFDPGVMYQFKIDNTGDHVEDLVMQFSAGAPSNGSQTITLYGPGKPNQTGTSSTWIAKTGTFKYNDKNASVNGMKVFAGPREDPFFFDLAQFFKIVPDRNFGNHGPGKSVPPPSAGSFRGFAAGSGCDTSAAQDFLSANKFNVLSLIVELPRTTLAPAGGAPGKISVWASASVKDPASPYGASYAQIERLARPAVKEAFESFDNHDKSNRSAPTNDPALNDAIVSFTTTAAGRSAATAGVLKAVLGTDEMLADLSQTGVKAAYLGSETGGATGSKFGGRGLTDDVIDISLGAIFGNTVSALKLAPDDGKESKCLTTDNVGPQGHHFTDAFPYIGEPT
jgi:Domain of unknown function (DUF4331)